MDTQAAKLEAVVRLTLCIITQRHHYPPGLLKRLEAEQARIFCALSCNHTPRPEWLENWGKEKVEAAANDPAERVRIAKLAARARWKNHVKQLQEKLMKKRGQHVHSSGRVAIISQKTVKKAFSGAARHKSFQNGVPNLVHLHAALNIDHHWQRATLAGITPSRKASESGKIDYARYTRSFRKNGRTYNVLITSKIILESGEEILYSIELS